MGQVLSWLRADRQEGREDQVQGGGEDQVDFKYDQLQVHVHCTVLGHQLVSLSEVYLIRLHDMVLSSATVQGDVYVPICACTGDP